MSALIDGIVFLGLLAAWLSVGALGSLLVGCLVAGLSAWRERMRKRNRRGRGRLLSKLATWGKWPFHPLRRPTFSR